MLDPHDLLDVSSAINAGTPLRLRDAKGREFGFPRAQHVGLQLDQITHLGRLEERAPGNVDLNGSVVHDAKSIAGRTGPSLPRSPTCVRFLFSRGGGPERGWACPRSRSVPG